MKIAVLVATIIILAAGVFGNYLYFNEPMPSRQADFSVLPLNANGYLGDERRFDEQSYEILRADTTTLRFYRGAEGEDYWLFIAYFSSQKYGSEIHSPKYCLPGGGWVIQSIEPYPLVLKNGGTKEISRVLIAQRDTRQLLFYWYETRGRAVNNEFELKWQLMRNSLLLKATDAAIVRVNLPFKRNESIEEASKRASTFLAEFHDSIERALPFAD